MYIYVYIVIITNGFTSSNFQTLIYAHRLHPSHIGEKWFLGKKSKMYRTGNYGRLTPKT